MKKRKSILPILSVLLSIFLLLGSTGITLIIHQCHSCNFFSVHAGIYLSPSIAEDDCCENAPDQCSSHSESSAESGCCHFTTDNLKITDYTSSVLVKVPVPANFVPVLYLPDVFSVINHPPKPAFYYNKHGARDTITFYSQFLA